MESGFVAEWILPSFLPAIWLQLCMRLGPTQDEEHKAESILSLWRGGLVSPQFHKISITT